MINIEKITDIDFLKKHPELLTIWQKDHTDVIVEAFEETQQIQHHGNSGFIYSILLDNQPIGLTGYFPYSSDNKEMGLRWHGVLESHRGNGYGSEAMRLVGNEIVSQHPEAIILIELLPLTIEGYKNKPYFESLGFTPRGKPEVFPWADHAWQEYEVNIQQLLENKPEEKSNKIRFK